MQIPVNGDAADEIFTNHVCSVAVVVDAAGEVAISAAGGEMADYIQILQRAIRKMEAKLAE